MKEFIFNIKQRHELKTRREHKKKIDNFKFLHLLKKMNFGLEDVVKAMLIETVSTSATIFFCSFFSSPFFPFLSHSLLREVKFVSFSDSSKNRH
jgi:hypothetical protein